MTKTRKDGRVDVALLLPSQHADFIKRVGAWVRATTESEFTSLHDDYQLGCIQLIQVGIKLIETQPGIMNEITTPNND